MDKNASLKADKVSQTSPEAPFTTFIQLDGMSKVHRNSGRQELLQSPGSSRRLGCLTESPNCLLSPLC